MPLRAPVSNIFMSEFGKRAPEILVHSGVPTCSDGTLSKVTPSKGKAEDKEWTFAKMIFNEHRRGDSSYIGKYK